MNKASIFISGLVLLLLLCNSALSHPGGIAPDGCHYCRTNCAKLGEVPDQRHCHRGVVDSSDKNLVKRTPEPSNTNTPKASFKEEIGAWELQTKIDEMTGKVISRKGILPKGIRNGVSHASEIMIHSFSNCSYQLSLESGLMPFKHSASMRFRARVDKNEIILLEKSAETSEWFQVDITKTKKLLNQMLIGKELLIDFNPDDGLNRDPEIVRFDLDGFDKVYERICVKQS